MAFLSTPPAWRRDTVFKKLRNSSLCRGRPSHTSVRMQIQDARGEPTRMFGKEFIAMDDPELDLSEIDDGIVGVIGADYDIKEKRKPVRKRTQELLEEIDRDDKDTGVTSDADSLPNIEDDETMTLVRTVVRAADERKAIDPVAIRVMRITYVTSFVVVLSGRNEPQVRAIKNLVEENMSKEHGLRPRTITGTPASGWILLDYGDMMVHIFTQEKRKFYNLEVLWSGGEEADISDYVTNEPEKDVEGDDESLDDWIS